MTIQEAHICEVAGDLSAGALCSRLISTTTNTLTFAEILDMINPQLARTCVQVPDFNICADNPVGPPASLPARAGAVILPADDFGTIISELQTACRDLGASCSYATQQILSKYAR